MIHSMGTKLFKSGLLIASVTAVLFNVSCKEQGENKIDSDSTESKGGKGFQMENFDNSVRPQDDLNKFVSGGWMKNNPVPSSESRWGAFNEIMESNRVHLLNILNNASENVDTYEKGSNLQKIGDVYKLAMDSVKLNREGVIPLSAYLQEIDAIESKDQLGAAFGKFKPYGVSSFHSFMVYIDKKKSDEMICYVGQSGLGLPDKDYYENDRHAEKREKYVAHIGNMLTFLKVSDAQEMAAKIMALETSLANNSMTRVERRNAEATYHKMHRNQLAELAPNFNFEGYFTAIGIGSFDSLIVSQPAFISNLNSVVDQNDLATIKAYMKWTLIRNNSDYLSDEVATESFKFYSQTLRGAKEQKPRWKRAISTIDGLLGEVLGQEYVKVAFSKEAKDKVNEMVDNLTAAYADRIKQLPWMSEETKKKALDKLFAVKRKLAYPDVWKDYSALSIEKDSYLANVVRARQWQLNENVNKLGKPIDRTEWGMTPSTVNAYYSPQKNEIVFPAGIMQPPFFDINADDAVNYGGIGAVIGHELSHGFDDQGSKYDGEGNLISWWTEEDRTKFEERTKRLSAQFSAFTVLDSFHVNGDLTLGENIADLGGVTMAYYALQKQLEKTGRKEIDGYSPEQRFYMGWAQVWRTNYLDEELQTRLVTDPHSPGMFRANGTPSNMTEFYKAFDIKEGDKMYLPESERIDIW